MNKLLLACFVGCLLSAVDASAQGPAARRGGMSDHISLGELTPTPEMWFYEQEMRRYADPKYAVRAKAEFRAVQRQRRIAAMKWFGMSNSRPKASPDPMYGSNSPHWASNSRDPFQWRGVAGPSYVVIRPRSSGTRAAR